MSHETFAGQTIQFVGENTGPFGGEYRLETKLIGKSRESVIYGSGALAFKALDVPENTPDDFVSLRQSLFQDEWTIGSGLTHPNLMPYYGQGNLINGTPDEARQAIMMPRIQGGSVQDLRSAYADSRMPPALAVRIISQAAQGLEHMHEQGLIHRDVKPHNIYYNYRARMADFGSATDLGERVRWPYTGTPHYVAPEQLRDGTFQTGKADTYGLAATSYDILTGKPVFSNLEHEIAGRCAIVHLKETPPDFEQKGVKMTKTMEYLQRVVLEEGLAKQPGDRPPVAEFASNLLAAYAAGQTAEQRGSLTTIIDLANSVGQLAGRTIERSGLLSRFSSPAGKHAASSTRSAERGTNFA